ncbi:MAG: DUF1292 domain-containing protein [Lachnospiraceae bacterium]|nr:DUF1292 domain-containing protein [Lachnospiraceae bacterium]
MDNNQNMPESIVFETEDGEEEFFVLEQTKLAGNNYILVTDDINKEDGSFLVLKEVVEDDEDFVSYDIVEAEDELKAVIMVFNELLEDIDLEV